MICQIGESNRDMGVITGVVTSENPLAIQADGDDKLLLNHRIIEVPRHLTDHDVTVDISGGTVTGETAAGGDPSHTHGLAKLSDGKATMRVYGALKRGEAVYLLSYNHGKKYFVLGRV